MIRPRVVALAIAFTIAALIATPTPAGGQHADAAPFPASIPLRARSGAVVCRGAPMADGVMSVSHCRPHAPLYIDDVPPAWSIDPTRDLLHLAHAASPAVVMRPAVAGERLRWRSDRAAGDVAVTWAAGGIVAFRHVMGSRLAFGDSGTGLHGDDGALVGVLSQLYHDGDERRIGRLTGGGELVQVP